MHWMMLIISLEANEVKARIPYQTQQDCQDEIPLALKGNWPNTVRAVCVRVIGE